MAKLIASNWNNLQTLLSRATRTASVYSPFYSALGLSALNSVGNGVSISFCTRLKLVDWANGVTDPECLLATLTNLQDSGRTICLRIHQQLHAKAYFADRQLGLIGSSNLTRHGFGVNVEALLLLRRGEAENAFERLERRFSAGAKTIELSQLEKWVQQYRSRISTARRSRKRVHASLLDAQLDADELLGLTGGATVIPVPTRELCDRFISWLRTSTTLAGAEVLLVHATDSVKSRRQGHFRKCFGAIYRFLHEREHWQAMLSRHLLELRPSDYFKPEHALVMEWRQHIQANANMIENEVCHYPGLINILPRSYGGSVTNGGGGISTLRRMLPLLARHIEEGML